MSRFYEVKKRDGAARIGRLLLKGKGMEMQTPLLLNIESLSSSGGEDKMEVIGVESPLFTELSKEETWNAPRGTVILPEIHPLSTKLKAASPLFVDFFVLAFASSMLHTPEDFVRRVIDARRRIPPDVALWVPAIATVENAALLAYMGVDIIDDANAVMKGYEGIYQLEECELRVDDMTDLPCNCPVCSSLSIEELRARSAKERAELLAKHNRLILEREVKKIRGYIRAGILREYVEMRVRASSFLTAVLRFLDTESEYFERRTPVARKNVIKVNTMESLRRIEVKRFASRVLDRYRPPSTQILVILPCSAKKPYSLSQSHRRFITAIGDYRGNIHELILTSPLGTVPRELELVYPAAFYDIPVTGYWDAEERAWVASCLRAYLDRNRDNYDMVVAHLRGAYKEICATVAEELGMEVIYTCEENEKEYTKEALERLRSRIAAFCGAKRRLSRLEMGARIFKAMADYQFGLGTGDELVKRGERVTLTGKYPHFRLVSTEGVLARIAPEYGLITLTTKGARRIEKFTPYIVEIGDFVPKGSILAPGVVNAGEEIRENDEVIFRGDKAFGVGRAKMSGWEMVESERGVAVNVREVREVEEESIPGAKNRRL